MMSASIKTIAPELQYSSVKVRRKRRKAKLRKVHPELRRMWVNADTIVTPVYSKVPPTPSKLFSTIDWSQVNKQFLSNVPTPSAQPVHGCSPDEELYKDEVACGGEVEKRDRFECKKF